MNPVGNPAGKALWFIESHFERELSLDEIASCGCVSRFHLSRARRRATLRGLHAPRTYFDDTRTCSTIWNKWLPESGHAPADAPNFERYSEQFDPVTGMGGVEIWVPLKR